MFDDELLGLPYIASELETASFCDDRGVAEVDLDLLEVKVVELVVVDSE